MRNATALLGIFLFAQYAYGEEPQSRRYQARLLDALNEHSEDGAVFSARIVGTLNRERDGDLARGTTIHGRVLKNRAVGLGIRRERASMQLEFNGCEFPDGVAFSCSVNLIAIDNAREVVKPSNVVQGIVAANHPHSLMSGVWVRPTALLFGRSVVGLTGAIGKVQSRLPPNPMTLAAIAGTRTLFFRLPEPELSFPRGTDLILRIEHKEIEGREETLESPFSDASIEDLQSRSAEIRQADRSPVLDIINFAFVATEEELKNAFRSAGWSEAEPLTGKSFAKTYKAFASMKTYSAAPVSQLFYQGKAPDFVFQKSFNTLAKRHHIRIWKSLVFGEEVWLGAATHDVGLAFDWSRFSMTHRIDLRIDQERSLVVNDLSDAGCILAREWLERPEMRQTERRSGARVTDGAMALFQLGACQPGGHLLAERRKTPKAFALGRRIILETRQYIMRGNPYYFVYWTLRWGSTRRVRGDAAE